MSERPLTNHPVLWVTPPRDLGRIPDVSDAALQRVFGDDKATSRIKSGDWNEDGVHWLITRSGLTMHNDGGYTRFTHHLVLRNDGFMLQGTDRASMHPPIGVGSLVCLDTHSEHTLCRDPRLEPGKYKAALVVDFDEALKPFEAWKILSKRLTDPNCYHDIRARPYKEKGSRYR